VLENGLFHPGKIFSISFKRPNITTHGTSVTLKAVPHCFSPHIAFVRERFTKNSPTINNKRYTPVNIVDLSGALYSDIENIVVTIKNHIKADDGFGDVAIILISYYFFIILALNNNG
tara:strand:+ start:65 stop:415 length:351 start_codon:yes stop_codon:yes gene_type:complete